MCVMCSQRRGSGGRSPGSFTGGGTTGSSDSSEIRDSASRSRPFFLEKGNCMPLTSGSHLHYMNVPCGGF